MGGHYIAIFVLAIFPFNQSPAQQFSSLGNENLQIFQ